MAVGHYLIERWDTLRPNGLSEGQLEQYVPPEVESIARGVLTKYDMNVLSMHLVTSKPDKGGAIWKLQTNHGPRSLKLLHRKPDRSLFSIGAQEYLVKKGARVPALVRTKEDHLYTEAGGKLWIVTDWIQPLVPVSKITWNGAATLCYGLGEFHHLSKGYVPPQGAQLSSRLHKWPAQYKKVISKMGWFRDVAEAYREKPASQLLLSVLGQFEQQAREYLERLQNSSYWKMAAMGGPYWGLAHQDFGWSNGQLGPGGIWVIDLDGVAYDFPIRDLRKIITSTMDDMGFWDLNWIRNVIQAYHQANPLDRQTYELLLIDMAFPNEFYKHIKEIVFAPERFLDTMAEPILRRIMATERNKWEVLAELERQSESYPAGEYNAAVPHDVSSYPTPLTELPGNRLPSSPQKKKKETKKEIGSRRANSSGKTGSEMRSGRKKVSKTGIIRRKRKPRRIKISRVLPLNKTVTWENTRTPRKREPRQQKQTA